VHRGDVDYPPVTALGHRGHGEPHGVKSAGKVHGKDRVPGCRVGLGEGNGLLDPGIVDQDIGPAPVRDLAHHSFDRGDIAHVGIEKPRFGRSRIGQLRHRRLGFPGAGQSMHRDPCPGARQRAGDGQPDALHGACDQRRPAPQFCRHVVSPFSMSRRSVFTTLP